jgi:hypothetical protein
MQIASLIRKGVGYREYVSPPLRDVMFPEKRKKKENSQLVHMKERGCRENHHCSLPSMDPSLLGRGVCSCSVRGEVAASQLSSVLPNRLEIKVSSPLSATDAPSLLLPAGTACSAESKASRDV